MTAQKKGPNTSQRPSVCQHLPHEARTASTSRETRGQGKAGCACIARRPSDRPISSSASPRSPLPPRPDPSASNWGRLSQPGSKRSPQAAAPLSPSLLTSQLPLLSLPTRGKKAPAESSNEYTIKASRWGGGYVERRSIRAPAGGLHHAVVRAVSGYCTRSGVYAMLCYLPPATLIQQDCCSTGQPVCGLRGDYAPTEPLIIYL